MKLLNWFFCLMLSSSLAQSTTFSPIDLVNVADGQSTVLQPCGTCIAMVVVFHSLKCPYDLHYAERIKKLVDTYGSNVSFFLVNSNFEAEEQPENMKIAYKAWGSNIPYLADKEQKAMTALGARRTPEAILIKKEGAQLKIVYQGAIDDNPQVHHDTDVNFLENAIKDVLAGRHPAIGKERAIGCTIRKK